MKGCWAIIFFLFAVMSFVRADENKTYIGHKENGVRFVGRMLEQGRTLVHNTVKRFMAIMPAIFFKLGIAFTMLLLVTIVSINNGFIGFLLLIVGLSSVLARLQDSRRPSYVAPLSAYYHQGHILDRSDDVSEKLNANYQYYVKPYSGYTQAAVYGVKQ